MKKIIYILPLFILFSCGGDENSEEQETVEESFYSEDHEWIVSAKNLKETLGDLQASFVEIGNKEVEEIICTESSTTQYNGNNEEMNIWLMSTYMLDNFSKEEFGKNNFRMPDAKIKDVTPLSDLNWLNFNSLDSGMFDIYSQYPDLIDIPTTVEAEDGSSTSNDGIVQNANMVLKAIEDGLFCVVAITDYLPPSYFNETEYETGYMMGYVMIADWENGQLGCVSPFLAQNNEELDFFSLDSMIDDLQAQTFNAIENIAIKRTGFEGNVLVNKLFSLEKYKDR